jgi:hypothetical protein
MNINDWIGHIDGLRREDELLAVGEWHGYLREFGSGGPLRGNYVLVRWRTPTVLVSHDDPDECVKLARRIERAAMWKYIDNEERPAVWAQEAEDQS